MKKNEKLFENYSVKNMTKDDSVSFSSDIMQSIKIDAAPAKLRAHRRTMFTSLSMIGSSVAAVLVATLLIVSQANNTISPNDLEVAELMTILDGLGEENVLSVTTDSESLYGEILLAEELEQKL
jgi:hypothetical protein